MHQHASQIVIGLGAKPELIQATPTFQPRVNLNRIDPVARGFIRRSPFRRTAVPGRRRGGIRRLPRCGRDGRNGVITSARFCRRRVIRCSIASKRNDQARGKQPMAGTPSWSGGRFKMRWSTAKHIANNSTAHTNARHDSPSAERRRSRSPDPNERWSPFAPRKSADAWREVKSDHGTPPAANESTFATDASPVLFGLLA